MVPRPKWEHTVPSVPPAAVSLHKSWLLAWTREVSCLRSQSLRFFFSPFMCMAFFQVPNVGSVLALSVQFEKVLLGASHTLVSGCTKSPCVGASGYAVQGNRQSRAVLPGSGPCLTFLDCLKSGMMPYDGRHLLTFDRMSPWVPEKAGTSIFSKAQSGRVVFEHLALRILIF